MPEFFSRKNARFFRDKTYRVWRGYLLVLRPTDVVIYRPYLDADCDPDFFCVLTVRDVEDARKAINVSIDTQSFLGKENILQQYDFLD